MRTLFAAATALCMMLCSCSEKERDAAIEYLPVKTTAESGTTLMAPDGTQVDFGFKGWVSPVMNGYFTVNGRKGYDVYAFDRKKPEAVDGLIGLHWAGLMNCGIIPVRRKELSELEFCDNHGHTLFSLPSEYRCDDYFSDDMLIISLADPHSCETRFGAVNTRGEIKAEVSYGYISRYSEGMAAACENGQWRLIDRNGEVLLTLEGVNEIRGGIHKGKIAVRKGSQWGFCDKDGEFTALNANLPILRFNGKYAVVADSKGCGIADTDGREVIPPVYADIQIIGHDRFACSGGDGRWDVLDSDGDRRFSIDVDELYSLEDNDTAPGGDFIIGGKYGDYRLYDSGGDSIPGTRFIMLY